MLELLQSYDREAMVLLNMGEQHSAGSDFFFWMVSQILIWSPIFLLFIYTIVKSKRKEAFLIIGTVILLFVLCDQITSSILKPLIARPRPSHDSITEPLLQYVYNYKGGAFGFPSSHASNSFGFAVFSSLLLRYKPYTCCSLCWALICAYSRIYLGVHFPGDIIVGTLLGICIAFLCYCIYQKCLVKFHINSIVYSGHEYTSTGYKKTNIQLIIFSLLLIIFTLFCGGLQIR